MDDLERAAQAIESADALLIAAGAGMGADSGLATFRGTGGYWTQNDFVALANPMALELRPAKFYGFYGYRLKTYRLTDPHAGFSILLEMARAKPAGYFCFTSNVDGAFQKAGFDDSRVVECHGSINHWQCAKPCSPKLYPAPSSVEIDAAYQWVGPYPACDCGAALRPNILMFGDGHWNESRTMEQHARCEAWLKSLGKGRSVVVLELGAGTAIPSVRMFSEQRQAAGATLIRINPTEAHGADIEVPTGALEALRRLASAMHRRSSKL